MTDVVVVGSDPGALAAAVACREAGWEVLVIEPGPELGADAARGAGRLWLPERPGLPHDHYADSRDYFDRVVGDPGPATSAPRRHAFLTGTGPLADWLADLGVGLREDALPEHYPELPGAHPGRVVAPLPVDAGQLGRLAEVLPDGNPGAADGLLDKVEAGARRVGGLTRGQRLVQGGAALVAGLLAACQRSQVAVWWDAPLAGLIKSPAGPGEQPGVVGVIVRRGGRAVRVFAGRAVIVAGGGFGGDDRLRREYLPHPTRVGWSLGAACTDGVPLFDWGVEFGIQLAGLGDGWWRPALWHPDGGVWDATSALAAPHGFVVAANGRRFVNEAGSGTDFCRAMFALARHSGPDAIPVWLVVDAQHRRRNRLGPLPPGRTARAAVDSGLVVSARSLPELAWQIKVDAAGLQATADRFDGFAETGDDDDFARGASSADRARGDRTHRPNPCLGAVTRGPFAAIRVVPGDVGTKGGWLTDEHQRVLRDTGPVPGLWAIGSAAASVTGSADPAPGVGLAEAMVAGRRCAAAISGQLPDGGR